MLDRPFTRKIRLYNGHEELVTHRFGINEKGRKVEHVTLEVAQSDRFLKELAMRRRRRLESTCNRLRKLQLQGDV